jgi:tRNA modification GTPase
MNHSSPIVALSTSPGLSAIAVLRASGENIIGIAGKIFKGKNDLEKMEAQKQAVGWIVDPSSGEKIDEVMMSVFRAPNSYTGEDVVEISTHGSNYISSTILSLLIHHGCRTAGPGEFTRRAFINGKMKLHQAEAVRDIIEARTSEQRRMALHQLEKNEFDPFKNIKSKLEHWLMVMEANIEFPDEEHVDKEDKKQFAIDLEGIKNEISELLANTGKRKKIREGILIPIAGKPNVGKSTLFNWFHKSERVIVHHEPGTTRDAVEEELEIAGLRVRLVDTAGIRESENLVEQKGIGKTKEFLKKADLILWMHDALMGEDGIEKDWLNDLSNKEVIHIQNKIDLAKNGSNPSWIPISLKENQGLDAFLNILDARLKKLALINQNSSYLLVYQQEWMEKALHEIEILLEKMKGDAVLSDDIISMEIKELLNCFFGLEKGLSSEDMLNRIFGTFCIGK